jgi:hypothetical protein
MSGGWTVVDSNTNKSLPIQGTNNSGTASPYYTPAPGQQDPVGKFRSSTPQSLIDTDFEYGTQPTKWESISLQNNRQSLYYISQQPILSITSIAGDGATPTVTILTGATQGAVVGQPIFIQNSNSSVANGWWYITAVSANVSITCQIAIGTSVPVANQFNQALTYVYLGYFYSNAGIQLSSTSAFTYSGAFITVTTTNPHGLTRGSYIYVRNVTSSSGGGVNGAYVVDSTPTANTLSYNVFTAPTGTLTNTANTTTLYARPAGFVEPRSFDGGVAFSAGGAVPNQQLIRQTRRYFRYQSGKSMQFSTGAQLTPVYDVEAMYLNGGSVGPAYVTVQTVQDHGFQAGVVIEVEGVETRYPYNPFNGQFTVTKIINNNIFEYALTLTSAVPTVDLNPAGINVYIHARNWDGAVTRCGLFDDQNGFYFEYDGREMYVCRRHSEKEGIGRINVTKNSSLVTGLSTQFRKQINTGQSIVIKGNTYKVIQINSATSINIAPAYRGVTATRTRYLITQTQRVPQDEWNQDKFDGTGPSGYKMDVGRMQMVYIDYTWYGAGTIRFGMRTVDGKVRWCHRMAQNNVNNAAYQRSGNLPARYEVANDPSYFSRMLAGDANGTLGAALGPNASTVWVEDTKDWPTSGYIYVKDDTNCEIMKYSSIGAFQPAKGCAPIYISERRSTITQIYPDIPFTFSGTKSPVTFTPDSSITGTGGNAQVAVQSITQNCAPMISHWGSSIIMDGGFNQEGTFIFTGGMNKYLSVAAGVTRPLIAVRLAPSVDNAIARNFGVREIVNRMQLQMQGIGVQTNGSFRLDAILNPISIEYTRWLPGQLTLTRSSVSGTIGTIYLTIADTTGTVGIVPGMFISGTGIVAGTTIAAVAGNRVTLSQALTGTASGTYTFTPNRGYTGIPDDWNRDQVGSGSLAQVLYFDNSGPGAGGVQASSGLITGGDNIASFYSENGGGASNYNKSDVDLTKIRDLGNSVLSGDGNVSTPGYPNGPDILVITATNIGAASANIGARISWTEAQA